MTTTAPMFTIDTLLFSKKLEKAGMKKEAAETLAEELREMQLKSSESAATKGDLVNLAKDLRNEIRIAMLTTIISLGAMMTLVAKFIN